MPSAAREPLGLAVPGPRGRQIRQQIEVTKPDYYREKLAKKGAHARSPAGMDAMGDMDF